MNTLFDDLSDKERYYMQIIKDLVNQERGLSHSLRKRRAEDIEAARVWLRQLPSKDTIKIIGGVLPGSKF